MRVSVCVSVSVQYVRAYTQELDQLCGQLAKDEFKC